MDTNRTVHATLTTDADVQLEIVRYSRSGKWWLEGGQPKRTAMSVNDAVVLCEDKPEVVWHEGRPGGQTFDARVRKMRARRRSVKG